MKKISSTKDKIFKVAQSLFAKEGYVSSSIQAITSKINISKPSLYHFFKNKEDLYIQVFQKAFDELSGKLIKEKDRKNTFEKKIENMITIYIQFGLKNHDIFSSAMGRVPASEKKIISFIKKLRKEISLLFESVIQEKIQKETMLKTSIVIGIMDSFLKEKIFFDEKEWTLKETIKIIINTILK